MLLLPWCPCALFPIPLLSALVCDCSPLRKICLSPSPRNKEAPANQGLSNPASIPEELVSLATIKHLGYNDKAAADIWGRWAACTSQLLDENGNIKRIAALASNAPADFCGREINHDFTVGRETAVLDACWATSLEAKLSSVVIVHATIRDSTIEDFSQQEVQRAYWSRRRMEAACILVQTEITGFPLSCTDSNKLH